MRNWIEDQHFKFVEKVKEARETLSEAKEKVVYVTATYE